MVSPSELILDCKPRSFSTLLKCFGDQTDQTYMLQEFLSRLEEERLKIDGLKRELPLCILLLTNAMEASRQQLQVVRTNQGARPVLEEFMPMKLFNSEKPEKESMNSDMANWMTTAQLCSQANEGTKTQSGIPSHQETEIGLNIVSPKLALKPKQINGGAFLPFSKDRNSSTDSTIRAPELTLASSEKDMEDKKSSEPDQNRVCLCPRRETCAEEGTCGVVVEQEIGGISHSEVQTATASAIYKPSNQPHRKARRCWSPDLHRRFVDALQMLGGCQVATPKQIRELMKVDGLTNDEVKSHLQKYRLHTRRPSLSPQAAGAPGPQLVVLRGIWFPPEYATAAAAHAHTGSHAIYTTHPAPHAVPSTYCAATPVPPEFYTAASSQPQLSPSPHHHPLHHQVNMYNKATSHGHSSPESNRSESIEDGKYENSSSKGTENGENQGERIGLAAMGGDGEESNESEITLKF